MFGAIIYSVSIHLNPFTSYIPAILLIFIEGGELGIWTAVIFLPRIQLLMYLPLSVCSHLWTFLAFIQKLTLLYLCN